MKTILIAAAAVATIAICQGAHAQTCADVRRAIDTVPNASDVVMRQIQAEYRDLDARRIAAGQQVLNIDGGFYPGRRHCNPTPNRFYGAFRQQCGFSTSASIKNTTSLLKFLGPC
jgi:hypothetical protein